MFMNVVHTLVVKKKEGLSILLIRDREQFEVKNYSKIFLQ